MDDALERAKRASTAQLLFRCARRVNERCLEAVRAELGVPIRPAHTALFPHLDLDGTRQTALAARLGVSKQAVGQLVDELVSMGVLERVPDPADGRARLVRFVGGREGLMSGVAALSRAERPLWTALGSDRSEALHEALSVLDGLLDVDDLGRVR